MIQKFVKKPKNFVEAIQFKGKENEKECVEFAKEDNSFIFDIVNEGDYIMKDASGVIHIYPEKYFVENYDVVHRSDLRF